MLRLIASRAYVHNRVLVLGAGLTAGPTVEYLTRDGTTTVTIGSRSGTKFMFPNTSATKIDVRSERELANLIASHDLVVSSLPFQLHPLVARQCIEKGVNMVTTGYITPALQDLHESACNAGVTVLNECGLDPGIDHMLAMECIDEVHAKAGKVVRFESWCAGLPENVDNALKYKFSWSPNNALLVNLNPVKYLQDCRIVDIPAGGSVMMQAKPLDLYPEMKLEGFFNRDATTYIGVYNIPEVQTIIRGALRYQGFCRTILGLWKLGLLSTTRHSVLQANGDTLMWKDFMKALMVGSNKTHNEIDLKLAICEALDGDDIVLKALESLRLLSEDPVHVTSSPVDALASHLGKLLSYAPGERDIVLLHTIVGIEWPDGSKEVRHIDVTHYGDPTGFSAMAKTTGIPAAIGAKLLLSGESAHKGMTRPTSNNLYRPILERLNAEGIKATAKTENV